MTITNVTRNSVLATKASVARTPWARMRGLLGKERLAPGEALVIDHCQSIHMFFMRFPLDIVFVDKNHKVVGVCARIKPFQLSSLFFKARKAIELEAGTIAKTDTQIGDFVQIG